MQVVFEKAWCVFTAVYEAHIQTRRTGASYYSKSTERGSNLESRQSRGLAHAWVGQETDEWDKKMRSTEIWNKSSVCWSSLCWVIGIMVPSPHGASSASIQAWGPVRHSLSISHSKAEYLIPRCYSFKWPPRNKKEADKEASVLVSHCL